MDGGGGLQLEGEETHEDAPGNENHFLWKKMEASFFPDPDIHGEDNIIRLV